MCCMRNCLEEVHSGLWDLIGLKPEEKLLEGQGRRHSERVDAHHQEPQGRFCSVLNLFDFVLDFG